MIKQKNLDIDLSEFYKKKQNVIHHGCPGSRVMQFNEKESNNKNNEQGTRQSELKQWPIQLHLVPPTAPYYRNNDVLLVADCVGYSIGDFHKDYMKNKAIAIACPKLDSNIEIYIEKIASMIDNANINSLTVMMMEVPCCFGLMHIAEEAVNRAKRKIEIKKIIVGINGDIKKN